MEEENKKRSAAGDYHHEYHVAGDLEPKRRRVLPANSDDTEDEEEEDAQMMALLSVDEETVSELSRLLEAEIVSPPVVKFIDDPYSLPLIFQSSSSSSSSSSYVTINGNEESCGSSFSDSDSSVMAGINIAAGDVLAGLVAGGAWGEDADDARGWIEGEGESCCAGAGTGTVSGGGGGINGCDYYDDDMLARFVGYDEFYKSSQ